jgi:hypothetical protein
VNLNEGAELLEAMELLDEQEVSRRVINTYAGDREVQKLGCERTMSKVTWEQGGFNGSENRDKENVSEFDDEQYNMGRIWLGKMEREDKELEVEDEKVDDQVELWGKLLEKVIREKEKD